jgi:hypothetical protein
MKDSLLRIALAASIASLAACQTGPPPNYGQSGYRMDPSRDSVAELRNQSPRSPDLMEATETMAMDIAGRLDVNNTESPPVIVVGEIENRTSMPYQNWQVFLVRLRGLLTNSDTSTRHGMRFVRERSYIEQQRQREYGTDEGYQSLADYVLTCEVYDLPSGGTNFFLLDYQLVQLRETTSGPNLGPGAIVWENKYEVKYQ